MTNNNNGKVFTQFKGQLLLLIMTNNNNKSIYQRRLKRSIMAIQPPSLIQRQYLESHVTIVPLEMTVEWFQENIKDAKWHETSDGQLKIGFRLDQECYIIYKGILAI
nr:15315_t:CDS:2 [Entrophospora candida]